MSPLPIDPDDPHGLRTSLRLLALLRLRQDVWHSPYRPRAAQTRSGHPSKSRRRPEVDWPI